MFRAALLLIPLLLFPVAFASGSAAAGGGPAPGVVTGWDGVVDRAQGVRYVAMPAARTTTVAVVRRSDGRVLRYATVNGVVRHSARRLRRHRRRDLARRPDARGRRCRHPRRPDHLRVPEHDAAANPEARHAAGPLGVRRRFARRAHDLRDPVPRHRPEPALQRSRDQPRHRQARRRRDRRQAGAGRGDERRPLGPRPQRQRRLGLHALRQAGRDRVRPRARHGRAAGVLCRPAVEIDAAGARARAPLAHSWAVGRSSCRSAAKWVGWRSSTRRRSR